MDIVVPLGTGSKHADRELLYAMRSAEKYLEFDLLCVVGVLPRSINPDIHIVIEDDYGADNIANNIHRKIVAACKCDQVSEDFILMSDDHYLYGFFSTNIHRFSDTVEQKMARYNSTDIRFKMWENSLAEIALRGLSSRCYDLHCPVVINKSLYLQTVATLDWSVRGGYAIKTMYANMNGIDGRPDKDRKIDRRCTTAKDYDRIISAAPWFSIGDASTNAAMFEYLEYLYPEKSRYELLSTH